MQPAFSWKTILKKGKFDNSWCSQDWVGLEFIEQNSSCTKQKMKSQSENEIWRHHKIPINILKLTSVF